MGGSRRDHTKTRNGCSNCKRRRVKCNLQAPQCHHCKRRGEECGFQHLNSPTAGSDEGYTPASNAHASLSSYSDSRALSRMQPSPRPDFGPQHTQLLWHFTTSTSATLAMFNDTRWTWDTEVPQQAETNAFLLHGLMAVSALHICYLRPPNSEQYYSAACTSFRNATVLFQTAVSDINRDNCIAVLAFILLMSIFQLSISQAPHVQLPEASVELIDAILALRGAWSLIGQLHPHLVQSRIYGLVSQRRNFGSLPLDNDQQRALDGLETLNRLSNNTVESQVACGEAVNVLRYWFSTTAGSPSTWLHLVWWPAKIPDKYLSLLKANDPVALVIFCHWCVGMHRAPRRWFLAGWAERTFHLAKGLLGPEWQHVLEWPIGKIV